MSTRSPSIDYARVEIRSGGVTYVYELEPDDGQPITYTVQVVTQAREIRTDEASKPWREFEPGDRTANINLAGNLAKVTRITESEAA